MSESETPRDPGIKALEDQTRFQLHETLLAALEEVRQRVESVVLEMEADVKKVPAMKSKPLSERKAFYEKALADYNRSLIVMNGPDGVNEQLRRICNSANMLGRDGLITDQERLRRIDTANERQKAVRAVGERGAAALGRITSVL